MEAYMKLLELNHTDVLALLPDRAPWGHKGDYGKLLLLCGSRGFTGAAALAAMGALRSGAGLVYLGVPESIYAIEAVKLTEPVVFPLPDEDGMLSATAVSEVKKLLRRMDAVLIGPGLGQSAGTLAVLETVLSEFQGPVVIDADGINLIAEHKDLLRDRTSPTILTPHEGEFARLGGDLKAGRLEAALETAGDLGAIVVLKGHNTVITDGSAAYINRTGNPGMAVGGSGDVLAGMTVSLLGQKLAPLEAAACAAWLHGAAGDLCAREIGQYGMLPSDMVQVLPRLMK
jgi:NAD(P)H-hydrate epimerase